MKILLLAFIGLSISQLLSAQGSTVSHNCVSSQGNIAIFSNYDGGVLNIDVDYNVPNLKIGVVSFAGVQVNITGLFAANVSEVIYAGIKTNGDINCNNPTDSTTITGVNPAITSIFLAPPHGFPTTYGYNAGIICGYSCDTLTWQGGCNTYDQIENYFEDVMNGTSFMFKTQYECWSDTVTHLLSAYGNCTVNGSGTTNITSSFSISDTIVCVNQGVNISNISSPTGTTVWLLPGTNFDSSTDPNLSGVSWSTTGIHQVYMLNSGCPVSILVDVVDCANLNEFLLENCFAFPNPSNGSFKVSHLADMDDFHLTDIMGKFIPLDSYFSDNEVNLTNFPNGIYYFHVSKNGFQKILQLIKD